MSNLQHPPTATFHPKSDTAFLTVAAALGSFYVLLVVLLIAADVCYTSPSTLWQAFAVPEIRYSFLLSLISSTITTILALWIAIPLGYLLSRWQMERLDADRDSSISPTSSGSLRSRLAYATLLVVDTVLDIPLVLPPLVVGVSLLVLFSYAPFSALADSVVYEVPAVILAQFTVSCAFATRTMRTTFDQIPLRQEQVAMTLGAGRGQIFWDVLLPQARRGIIAAATLSWARALGEFGPVLIFAGSISMRTEVLPTTIFLKLEQGNLPAALSVSVCMIVCAMLVLAIVRFVGWRRIID